MWSRWGPILYFVCRHNPTMVTAKWLVLETTREGGYAASPRLQRQLAELRLRTPCLKRCPPSQDPYNRMVERHLMI